MNYTKHFECGCKIVVIGELHNAEIYYCLLHKAAPEMSEALKQMLVDYRAICQRKLKNTILQIRLAMAEKALAKAEGKDV